MNSITDEELEAALALGLTTPQIALQYGITKQAVNKRRKRARFQATTVSVVAPETVKRQTTHNLDAQQQLLLCMERLNLLQDAYHEWLTDADDPTRYDIGPRATEVKVTYWESKNGSLVKVKTKLAELLKRAQRSEIAEVERLLHDIEWSLGSGLESGPAKASLQALIARVERSGLLTEHYEVKFADPRVEMRNTLSVIANTVKLMIALASLLADAKAMSVFRESLLEEIAQVEPEVAQRIAAAVRRRLVFSADPIRH
jgi:hypothetical protein